MTFLEQLDAADTIPCCIDQRFSVPPNVEAEFLNLWLDDAAFILADACLSEQLYTEGQAAHVSSMSPSGENAQTFVRAFRSHGAQSFSPRYPDTISAPQRSPCREFAWPERRSRYGTASVQAEEPGT